MKCDIGRSIFYRRTMVEIFDCFCIKGFHNYWFKYKARNMAKQLFFKKLKSFYWINGMGLKRKQFLTKISQISFISNYQ